MIPESARVGKAGELRVASELILRGYNVYLTFIDDGIDLVLDDGRKIQVKTSKSHKVKQWNDKWADYGIYTFGFRLGNAQLKCLKKGIPFHTEPHPLTGVDIVILWTMDDNDFYIIPAEEIRGTRNITINATKDNRMKVRKNKWFIYRNNWDVLKGDIPQKPKGIDEELIIKLYSEGNTLLDISKRLDISVTPIYRVVRESGILRTASKSKAARNRLIYIKLDSEIKKSYEQGYNMADISEKVGISIHRVAYALRRMGITRNSHQSKLMKKTLIDKLNNNIQE